MEKPTKLKYFIGRFFWYAIPDIIVTDAAAQRMHTNKKEMEKWETMLYYNEGWFDLALLPDDFKEKALADKYSFYCLEELCWNKFEKKINIYGKEYQEAVFSVLRPEMRTIDMLLKVVELIITRYDVQKDHQNSFMLKEELPHSYILTHFLMKDKTYVRIAVDKKIFELYELQDSNYDHSETQSKELHLKDKYFYAEKKEFITMLINKKLFNDASTTVPVDFVQIVINKFEFKQRSLEQYMFDIYYPPTSYVAS